MESKPVWDSYEPAPGDEKPPPRADHVLVTINDLIILFVCTPPSSSSLGLILYRFGGADGQYFYNDTWSFDISTRKWTELRCTGCIPSPRRGHVAAVVDDVMYVFGGRGVDEVGMNDLSAFKLSSRCIGMSNFTHSSFTCNIQPSDGSRHKTWDQVQGEGEAVPWLRMGPGSLCLEDSHQRTHKRRKLRLFTFSTQVGTLFLSFHLDNLPF